MKLIAAADAHWGIGLNGKLLTRLSKDLLYFQKRTMGHPIIMGRKTLESLPNGKLLEGRTHIVLSQNARYERSGVTVCHSLQELLKTLSIMGAHDAFVIGGGEIYTLLLSQCTVAYITRIQNIFRADTFFPDLDQAEDWQLTNCSDTYTESGISYKFTVYRRKKTRVQGELMEASAYC